MPTARHRILDHLAVAGFEDVQRQMAAREQDRSAERKQG